MNRIQFLQSSHSISGHARPTIVSILSGKGGVGKSVIAFNLSERLSSLGHQTLLVDADSMCGNIHILANVQAERGFQQFASGSPLSQCECVLNDTWTIMASGSNPAETSGIDVSQAARVIERLRQEAVRYDFVVIDHGSGVSNISTVMAHGSDVNLLVLIPELTSIADCYGLYKYLLNANGSIDCRLLVNRTVSEDEAEYVQSKFFTVTSRFLGRIPGYSGHLSESTLVRRSVARQMPMVGLEPEAPILQQLTGIIENLVGPMEVSTTDSARTQETTINERPETADTRG